MLELYQAGVKVNKTKIPWCDYTINPVKGLCPMACEYCYARRMYKRFKWGPEMRYDPTVFMTLPIKPSRVFVGSTIELFGGWNLWMDEIISLCRRTEEHTFIFLTKKPENLIKWSPFPENCYVGITCDTKKRMAEGYKHLCNIEAKVKYISFEPLLERMDVKSLSSINWVIIGSRTQPTRHPPKEWIDEIITASDKANIPIFIKEPLASHIGIHRQGFPGVERVIYE